jgi:hypothetical protein
MQFQMQMIVDLGTVGLALEAIYQSPNLLLVRNPIAAIGAHCCEES